MMTYWLINWKVKRKMISYWSAHYIVEVKMTNYGTKNQSGPERR